jgi:hypothetical protein
MAYFEVVSQNSSGKTNKNHENWLVGSKDTHTHMNTFTFPPGKCH